MFLSNSYFAFSRDQSIDTSYWLDLKKDFVRNYSSGILEHCGSVDSFVHMALDYELATLDEIIDKRDGNLTIIFHAVSSEIGGITYAGWAANIFYYAVGEAAWRDQDNAARYLRELIEILRHREPPWINSDRVVLVNPHEEMHRETSPLKDPVLFTAASLIFCSMVEVASLEKVEQWLTDDLLGQMRPIETLIRRRLGMADGGRLPGLVEDPHFADILDRWAMHRINFVTQDV